MTVSGTILATDRLTAGYGGEPIIRDITTGFRAGTITALIGTNGAGKSTFLKSLFGMTTIFGGSVGIEGTRMRPVARDLVAKGIAYVPQVRNVFPGHSVKTNLEIGAYVRRGGDMGSVLEVFPALRTNLRVQASKLSGGQRNMLAVGRALMSNPRVLLLDEPTGGLAPNLAAEFWVHLETLRRANVCIIAVEQNVDLALAHSDCAYLFGRGQIIVGGGASELAARADFETLFLEGEADPRTLREGSAQSPGLL